MKKWFKFFFLGFFSHSISKSGTRHGYSSIVLSLILVALFIWSGTFGGYMLPFGYHYDSSSELKESVHMVFANADEEKRIYAEIENGRLKVKKSGGEYTESLLINTMENEEDKENYSKDGVNIVIDTRPAATIAEVEAYCISNDGKETVISYEDYLTLSEVARLNFNFKLRYTGDALIMSDELIGECKAYIDTLSDEIKAQSKKAQNELSEGKITDGEYKRAIYELYFTNYYPSIKEYESTSRVPLLRNYYYHEYISKGLTRYLFIFDDYMAGSFEARGKNEISFYGFYGDLENGSVVEDGKTGEEANISADRFIKESFKANRVLNAYGCLTNTISILPFIALMIMVAALLSYSLMKLRGVESIRSLGDTLKIVGSYVWFSGLIAAVICVLLSFFVGHRLLNALPQVVFFTALIIRTLIFVINETKLYLKKTEKAEGTEV